nr:MAG TPA: hypothetical protein [Caudoviricetes sp.]
MLPFFDSQRKNGARQTLDCVQNDLIQESLQV